MSDSQRVQAGSFMAFVRSQTFRQRPDLDLLFVAVDEARLITAWLVPSEEFATKAGRPTSSGRLRFYASMKPLARDRWRDYRLTPTELAPRILARLNDLDR